MPSFRILTLLLAILIALPATAHAYVDPGTGSFVLQAVIAGILGLSVTLKMYWHRIFGGKKKQDDDDELDD
jgi:hypothetical protein